MSDQQNAQTSTQETGKVEGEQETTEPTLEDLQQKVADLTAHSRKWEERAKENYEARKELDALREQNMSEDEKAQAALAEASKRAEDAEQRASEAEAALLRYKIATEFNLGADDVEALAAVKDEAALRTLAERLAGRSNTGPKPNPSQGRGGSPAPASPGQAFADALEGLF